MYNPSLHTATNKPIGLTGKPVDARTYYYDTVTFMYRPYASAVEVLGYLIGGDRTGHFSIIIGSNEYWFKDGIADSDLVLKYEIYTPLPAIEIDYPIGSTDFFVDLAADYPAYINTPTLWVEIVRTEAEEEGGLEVTEQLYMPINRNKRDGETRTIEIQMPINPSIDHYRLIIKA